MDKKIYETFELVVYDLQTTDIVRTSLAAKDKFTNDGWELGKDDFVQIG
jgi:hypothetical protein